MNQPPGTARPELREYSLPCRNPPHRLQYNHQPNHTKPMDTIVTIIISLIAIHLVCDDFRGSGK